MNVSTRMRTALNDGYAALDLGSRERAEAQLGLAVRLATEIAADWVLDEVRKVARIVDGPRGSSGSGRPSTRAPSARGC